MLLKLGLGVLKFNKEKFIGMRGLFEMLSRGQYPQTLFVTCSDSRLVPSLFTGSDPGDMFVVRNVGNIIPPKDPDTTNIVSEAVAIEYALKVLNVKNIILCGHSDCGAMKSLFIPNLEDQLPTTASWLRHSAEVLKKLGNHENTALEEIIKQNILVQIEHLKTYPIVAEKMASGELSIHGWFYKFELGEILVYQECRQNFITMEQALKDAIEERIKTVVKEVVASPVVPKTWEKLKPLILDKLWVELGELYSDPLDEEYQSIIESAKQALSGLVQSLFQYGGSLFANPLSQSEKEGITREIKP